MSKSLNDLDSSTAIRRALSCLADGDRSADDTATAFAGWSQDEASRSTWHAYHLIGDVLRSDDLASTSAHDEAFLKSLRGRLAAEPVAFSPTPLLRVDKPADIDAAQASRAAGGVSTRRYALGWWLAPAAVAAGFVAVAGLLVVTRVMSPNPLDQPQLALAQSAGTSRMSPPDSAERVHTAGLDRYLEAHRSSTQGVVAAGGAEHRVQIVFENK